MRERVLIVGAARSGTSVTAELIGKLGYFLPGNLIGPHIEHNPHGHFEAAELHTLTRGYRDGHSSEAGLAEGLRGLRAKFEAQAKGRPWAVKDPALVFCLDRAYRHFAPAAVVFVTRTYKAVAESRRKHTGWSLEDAEKEVALTFSKLYESMRFAQEQGIPYYVLGYESLIAYPYVIAEELADWLGVEYEQDVEAPARIVERAASVVDPALCRSQPNPYVLPF